MTVLLALFIVFLMLMVPAFLSVLKHDRSTEDYLNARRSIHWLPAGVSAGVSMLSGFSFTALVGYAYTYGAFAIWFVIIRNVGEILISWYIWPRLYDASLKHNCSTLSQLAGTFYGRNMKYLRMITGIIIASLLTIYTSSQLQSAGIALENTMEIDPFITIAAAGTILMVYCFWGGIRSSIWTDNSQAVLMLVTLCSVPAGIIYSMGGFDSVYHAIVSSADADYLNPFTHPDIPYKGLYIFSLLFIGFCILGQPHVFSRFMTVENRSSMRKAQMTYYVTALSMNLIAVIVGIMVRAIISPETFTDASGTLNAESALFTAALMLFPMWFVYFIAAGGASAALSTSDSQIQAASTSFIIDVVRPIKRFVTGTTYTTAENDWTYNHWATKITTGGVIIIATVFALILSQKTVFDIVEVVWSTQGSLFFAVFVMYSFTKIDILPNERQLLFVMVLGVVLTLSWKFMGLNIIAYPAMLGMTASTITVYVMVYFKRRSDVGVLAYRNS